MRTLTIAAATWREAIRQPVSIIILCIAAVATFLSQFLNFYQLDEETSVNVIRQMSVAQTLMCGIVIAVFTASAVLAEEIENKTVLTLLAKPVRRHEVVLGKFLGILMAILAAFGILMFISLATVWWNEAAVDRRRTNPVRVARKIPWLATGQSVPVLADSYEDLVTIRDARGVDYLRSAGDVLLLVTGQSAQLVARVPLTAPSRGGEGSPGLASIVRDLLGFAAKRTRMLLQAFALAFVHVMVIAAVAIAVSTRLPLVFNALFCAAFFVLGNVWYDLSREWFGADIHVLPNFQNLNLTEALSVGIAGDPWGGWASAMLYGVIYTGLLLLVAVLLFRRREVA